MRYLVIFAVAILAFLGGQLFNDDVIAAKIREYLAKALSDPAASAAIASASFALLSLVVQYLIGSRQAIIGTQQAEALPNFGRCCKSDSKKFRRPSHSDNAN
jgi:hypothetical protein